MSSKLILFPAIIGTLIMVLAGCGSSPNSSDSDSDREVRFTHELVSDELEYPWQMAFTPDGRLLVTEVKGTIRVFENESLQEEPWFDISDYMMTEQLQFPQNNPQRSGLQGIAVDPNFESNGYVYVGFAYHTDEVNYDYNRLIRLKENPETGKGEFDKVLLDKVGGFDLHQAAQIKFGPDGKLYWSVGDRFEEETAQDLEDLSGSILRMNPDGSIPGDNPFSNSYIYSYGHRNPQGFSWHPETGMMMATEHGPSSGQGCCRDEINIIEPGANYGWPEITGDETASGMKSPLIHSGNEPEDAANISDSTWAPSGATFVQSGPWKGTFLFAGLRSKTLWQIKLDENGEFEELVSLIDAQEENYHRARSVNQSPDGTIYMITSNMDRTYNPELGRNDYLVKINVFYEDEGTE